MPREPEDAKVTRELIYKENELMNSRITWLVTLQGLLFAALGFAWKDAKELISILGWLGIAISIAAMPPLYYAHHAIAILKNDWEKHKEPSDDSLPVIGHYHKETPIDKLLSWISLWWILPILFVAAWAYLLYTVS